MTYVADTHPLVRLLEKSPRLSPGALGALTDSTARVIIPSITLAELRFLFARGRTLVDLPMALAHISAADNASIYPLDELVVQRLPASLDIHDAIIVATALAQRDLLGDEVRRVTRDKQITASGLVPVLW
jgi:predicted nucleic acid-binding protein